MLNICLDIAVSKMKFIIDMFVNTFIDFSILTPNPSNGSLRVKLEGDLHTFNFKKNYVLMPPLGVWGSKPKYIINIIYYISKMSNIMS